MLCQRLKSCTSNICSERRRVYWFYRVHFPRCLFGFALLCYFSLYSCSLLVHFLLVVWVFVFSLDKHFFCNNPLVSCSFLTSLNLHGLFVCYCLLVLYLIISLAVISVFDFFCFF